VKAGESTTRLSISGKPVLVPGVTVTSAPIKDPSGNSNSPGNWIGVGNEALWYLEPIRKIANDRADGELRLFGFETIEPGIATNFSYTGCLKDSNAFGGFVASNSMFYSSGAPKLESGVLAYTVGGLHYLSNGQLAKGNYEMHILQSVANCINRGRKVSPYASVSVVNDQGQKELATTVVRTTGDWISLRASNFTFSQKTIRVDLNSKKPRAELRIPVTSIRAVGQTKARVAVMNPVGLGKIALFLDGRRLKSASITSSSDNRLTKGRLVWSLNLKSTRNNEIVLKVNGKEIQKVTYKR